jgi:hypothetical protein
MDNWILMKGTLFYDGSTWVTEYPDACRYLSRPVLMMPFARKIGATHIVTNYGTNVERKLEVK